MAASFFSGNEFTGRELCRNGLSATSRGEDWPQKSAKSTKRKKSYNRIVA
jgi:hypothetical protein